jgi:SAM-dependent methyltransferase
MWYKDWFNSEYYHVLYRHRDESEAEAFIDGLVEKFGLKPGMKVLDLPCGRGRHAKYLAQKGLTVFAADLADQSIAYAQEQNPEQVHFSVHDMLDPFPEKNFDAVLNLFTSFGYFDYETNDLKALQNFADALKDGGLLLIDFLNPAAVKRQIIPQETKIIDGISFHISKKIEGPFVLKTVSFQANNLSFSHCEKVRLFEVSDFERLLSATKLQIIGTFGDYSFQPYQNEASERLIIAARKWKI